MEFFNLLQSLLTSSRMNGSRKCLEDKCQLPGGVLGNCEAQLNKLFFFDIAGLHFSNRFLDRTTI